MSYSIDFRRKVLSVQIEDKLSNSDVVNRFKLGVATVVRWRRRLEILPRLNKAIKIDTDKLRADVIKYPDAYHYERANMFRVSETGMLRALRRLGIKYKKTLLNPKANKEEPQLYTVPSFKLQKLVESFS